MLKYCISFLPCGETSYKLEAIISLSHSGQQTEILIKGCAQILYNISSGQLMLTQGA